MLRQDGARELRAFTAGEREERFVPVTDGVWHVTGYGHSNAVVLETAEGVVLVDTLDTLERGQRLREAIRRQVGKEVAVVIYTHGHPDHTGGAGAFADLHPRIIAFSPSVPPLKGMDQLKAVTTLRGGRQFGYGLSDGENISQGIGRREGVVYGERRAFVAPDAPPVAERQTLELGGLTLELVPSPGEAEDAGLVWLPEKGVLCCGDLYYGCFPNLCAIRGGPYRDIATWIDSLALLRSFPADYLLPGHTGAVVGAAAIQARLAAFQEAIQYLLTATLAGMDAGKGPDQLAAEICLPPQYAQLPFLGEHYGCAEWTVRAIYAGYLGWFDGNPTLLHPLPPRTRAEKTLALMGGGAAVRTAAGEALAAGEYQWCLELCDLLLAGGGEAAEARRMKAQALRALAEWETSANGRHYYLACARELEEP